MARPRTATNILNLRGSFKKNSHRKRKDEPKIDLPFDKTPPARLTPGQKSAWNEIVEQAPSSVLTGADRLLVEIVARLLAEYLENSAEFATARLCRLTSEMHKIGLSPSSRASLTVDRGKENDFDDI